MSSKKIRDIERILRKKKAVQDDADPLVIAKLEEQLQALKDERAVNAAKMKEKKLATKYHMVKFFERRKLTRRIKALDNKIASFSGSKKDLKLLQSQRSKLEEDLTYVMYFPKEWKYISVFAGEGDDEKTSRRRADAKQLAIQQRAQELSVGEEDRVKHALEVEFGQVPKEEKSSETKTIKNKKKLPSNGLSSVNETDETIIPNDNSRQDIENAGKKKRKRERDADTPEIVNSDSNDRGAVVSAANTTTSTTNSASDKFPQTTATATVDRDPFFLEEIDITSPDVAAPSAEGAKQFPVKKKFKGRRADLSLKNIDESLYSKQELRLMRWQAKVRGNNRGGGRGGGAYMGGRESGHNHNAAFGNKR